MISCALLQDEIDSVPAAAPQRRSNKRNGKGRNNKDQSDTDATPLWKYIFLGLLMCGGGMQVGLCITFPFFMRRNNSLETLIPFVYLSVFDSLLNIIYIYIYIYVICICMFCISLYYRCLKTWSTCFLLRRT